MGASGWLTWGAWVREFVGGAWVNKFLAWVKNLTWVGVNPKFSVDQNVQA